MRSVDNIAEELFDKIRSRVANIKLGDENGAVTTNPTQARFCEFQFKHRDLPIGAVTISLNEEGILQVTFLTVWLKMRIAAQRMLGMDF